MGKSAGFPVQGIPGRPLRFPVEKARGERKLPEDVSPGRRVSGVRTVAARQPARERQPAIALTIQVDEVALSDPSGWTYSANTSRISSSTLGRSRSTSSAGQIR